MLESCLYVCVCVCVCVCSTISARGAQTSGPIGTGMAPFDAPIRRNDDGAARGSVRATCHVPRGAAQTSARNILSGPQVKRRATRVSRLDSGDHVTPTVNHDPLCFPSPRGARRTCQGRTTVLTRDPTVQGNVEMVTRNLAH